MQNRHLFQGRVVHVHDLHDAGALAGKRVVIVGGSKAAIDTAMMAHQAGAAATTVVYRRVGLVACCPVSPTGQARACTCPDLCASRAPVAPRAHSPQGAAPWACVRPCGVQCP